MCLGIPMRVAEMEGFSAKCIAGERVETIDMSLVGPQSPGTWVLVFLGAARDVLDEQTAEQITRALAGLDSVMRGEGVGDAFADLDNREPTLPPHLEAARRAGARTA